MARRNYSTEDGSRVTDPDVIGIGRPVDPPERDDDFDDDFDDDLLIEDVE